VGKKAWSEKFFGKKIQKKWEFHDKVYAEPKPAQNNFPKRETQICPIDFFPISFDPSDVLCTTVRILYNQMDFQNFGLFEQCTCFSTIAWSLAVLQCICFPSVWQIKVF